VAPSLWYFHSQLASRNSLAVGLVVVALSVWLLWTGPRARPPIDPAVADLPGSDPDDNGRVRSRA
jgi:hypothetical protein